MLGVFCATKVATDEEYRKYVGRCSFVFGGMVVIGVITAALTVMLAGMYFAVLIGGLWDPILTKIMAFLLVLFMFSYIVAYRIISGKI